MGAVGLLFVGAVLFVNAIMLLGRVDPRSGAVFNLFVGALQTFVPIYLIANARTPDDVFLASGIFLFGFTYLYVGITNLAKHPPYGLGWYCSWVSITALAYALASFLHFHDAKFGVIWLMWSFLWGLFFVVLGLGQERFTRFTAWVTMIEAWITAAIPAYLILGGWWNKVSTTLVVAVGIGAAVVFAALAVMTIQRPRMVPATPSGPAGDLTAGQPR
jgi:hypothetical protein